MTIAAIASIPMRWRPLVLLVALFSLGGLGCVGHWSGLTVCPGGDQTAALNDQIAAAPDHSTVTLVTHGCYEIDGTVMIAGKTDVTLDGNGAVLQRFGSPARWAPILQLSRDHTIRVHELRIDGFKPDTIGYVPDREGQHGIVLDGADHVTLDHLTIGTPYQFRLQIRQRGSQCHLKSRCFMQWTVAVSEADVHKWSPWTPVAEAVVGRSRERCTQKRSRVRQTENSS